jgi:hypothetical protein
MKFATLIALVAVVNAQDEEGGEGEEAAAALEAGADCSAEGSVCGEGLCCGTATGAESEEGAADGVTKVLCAESDATTFDDADDSGEELAFACNEVAAEGGAAKLAASTAALLSAAYLLA